MNAGDLCTRDVVVVRPHETIVAAARRMRDRHVGDLVIVDDDDGRTVPIGILTDRDIVVEVVAKDAEDAPILLVRDVVIERPLVVVQEDESTADAVHRMSLHGVRRVPVVDELGGLVGILTMDDVVGLLAEHMADLSIVAGRQIQRERETRP